MTKGPFDSIMTGPEMLENVERFLAGDSRRSIELAKRGPIEWVITITDIDPRRPIYGGMRPSFPPRAMYYTGEARTAADAWMVAVRKWKTDHPNDMTKGEIE